VELIEDARKIIETILIDTEGSFAPRSFESAATIYRVSLQTSFVAALVNGAEVEVSFGTGRGGNRYGQLLKWLRQLTGGEPLCWFYVCDSSPGVAALSWVRAVKSQAADDDGDDYLSQFEVSPAPAGGGAHLGLLGSGGKWLLLHSHYAAQEFEISIHGPVKLCNDLCRLVRSDSCGVE
jgi:hypothetical protein